MVGHGGEGRQSAVPTGAGAEDKLCAEAVGSSDWIGAGGGAPMTEVMAGARGGVPVQRRGDSPAFHS